jgi:hypothetical protein
MGRPYFGTLNQLEPRKHWVYASMLHSSVIERINAGITALFPLIRECEIFLPLFYCADESNHGTLFLYFEGL